MLSESLFICFFFAFLIALIFAFILLFYFFIEGHLLRLTPGITKLRPVDFSELVLSLICRTRSGQGHRGSTTAWLLVQQWTW